MGQTVKYKHEIKHDILWQRQPPWLWASLGSKTVSEYSNKSCFFHGLQHLQWLCTTVPQNLQGHFLLGNVAILYTSCFPPGSIRTLRSRNKALTCKHTLTLKSAVSARVNIKTQTSRGKHMQFILSYFQWYGTGSYKIWGVSSQRGGRSKFNYEQWLIKLWHIIITIKHTSNIYSKFTLISMVTTRGFDSWQ